MRNPARRPESKKYGLKAPRQKTGGRVKRRENSPSGKREVPRIRRKGDADDEAHVEHKGVWGAMGVPTDEVPTGTPAVVCLR